MSFLSLYRSLSEFCFFEFLSSEVKVSVLACVASVSSRVRRESWDESKEKGMTGEGEGILLPL